MKKNIKITIIAVIALITAIYSITASYSMLTRKDDGVAVAKEEMNKIEVEVKDSITSSETIEFIGDPAIEDNDLIFSIDLDTLGSYGLIYFDIYNNGDFDCIYDGFEVEGLDKYKDYVNITINDIKKGDKIEKGASLRNLSLKVSYVNPSESIINLNVVRVKFKLDVVK